MAESTPLTAAEREELEDLCRGMIIVRHLLDERDALERLANGLNESLDAREAECLALAEQLAEAQGHARNHHLEACETCMAMECETDEARGIAWQLREACGTVLRDAYNEDWPEVSAAAAAFDALHWPDRTPEGER